MVKRRRQEYAVAVQETSYPIGFYSQLTMDVRLANGIRLLLKQQFAKERSPFRQPMPQAEA